MKLLKILCFVFILTTISCSKTKIESFKAFYTTVSPKIDGNINDSIWHNIPNWYTNQYIWLNNDNSELSKSDFSWKYKLAWDENKFYVLAQITDDVLNDTYQAPKDKYYEDDCFEVLFDEDNSGGNHQTNYQAFIYHISLFYDAVDIDNNGNEVLLNDHVNVKMDTINGSYIWEASFNIYDKDYISTDKSIPVKLNAGKIMGWSMAYCDNDGKKQRDHFIGTNPIKGKDKNITWKTADAFGKVELIKP